MPWCIAHQATGNESPGAAGPGVNAHPQFDQGERLPSLQAQGDYGLIGNKADNTLSSYNVGVTLSIPIFDGGQREGRIGESRSHLLQEEIKMNMVTRQITMELREALITLTSAKEQLRIAKIGRASCRERV